ncbi:hypothetical protein N7457_001863 [Penicillium paradoxum]|uniref:uncharacterized protein n=1 Tax=Penicillium paradoxum TaxID=176176 RepID=UPI002549AB49|nr:uncharacterized protein N7457_001863 [Penicillium paradoxum]KAJ5795264.1 hypothetical protein N7457_001863 [Penicillium paradoxum]
MKMEDQSTSPRDEDVLSQTQDPLERRRLQNRLSQRNHRRKIRERIAKLQERVIANELRAAAALNGWDQTYNPSLFPRAHSVPQHDHGFALRDVPPSIPDQCTPFMPLYPSFASHSWSNDLNTFPQHSGCPGDLPQFTEASEASPISPIPTISSQSTNGISSATGVGSESYRELAGTSEPLIPDSLSTSAPNQPLYYVATGIYPNNQHRNYHLNQLTEKQKLHYHKSSKSSTLCRPNTK